MKVLEELETYRLSSARRFFVVMEMLERALEREKFSLAKKMQGFLISEEEQSRSESRQERGLSQERTDVRDGDERQHLSLLLLLTEILRSCEPEEEHFILAPLVQQLRRLKVYAGQVQGRSKEREVSL